ncbi:MAG TPA: hypothetical protein VN636_02370 [Acidimicrobiia bacterium]|nr:hypothetical protein [Acidimicrobiia bacterium]
MISDTDLEHKVRASVSDLHMRIPVEAILDNARRRRRSRRIMLSATAVVGCAAVALAAIGLTATHETARTAKAQLAAFTLSGGPGGSASLTLHKGAQYRLDPDALRRALAEHGIPALVTVGTSCDTNPEPDGLDRVVTASRQSSGDVFITINPGAIPAGAELSIGYFSSHTRYSLIEQKAPKTCSA